ncbi:PREDICTED: adhesion G-protein coupled receptor F1 [Hipposideros armiger]|uniref:Adhesion G-protein coupled receptor F1 n=1 Tax=Hipposideros armiger TaxID=186990 RepID=A0A8B7TE99_HIPAR|nr:PREDICTED: adhesion G-protein coupled receptor F1 [Hipposideros armiger]
MMGSYEGGIERRSSLAWYTPGLVTDSEPSCFRSVQGKETELLKMKVAVFWLISFFIITEGRDGFLGGNDDIKTKKELSVNKKKHPGPVQEYELLLQVSYKDSKEKRDLKNFLKLLKPPSLWLHGPTEIIRAKATTYCGSHNGVLRCACEDGYTWFPPSCLDPQKCYFHMAESLQSCDCHLNNLSQSVNFCERTKVWGTFKINERFTEDLWNSSSAKYSKYTTGIEIQDVISIADHILNSASVNNWTTLLQEEKHASSRFLETLENISALVPATALPLNFSREFINWKGIPVSESQHKMGYNYQTEIFPPNTSIPIRGHVIIGSNQFQGSLPETIISMASLTLGNILPITKTRNAQVNGPVISTIIQNYSIDEIFLSFSKIDSHMSQPHCVFWDFGHLQWNDAGCHLVNETPDTVMCWCTHLTSFSMLMSPFVPSTINPVVKWITFVGLGFSIGSLILCLIIEALFWKQVKKSQTSYTRHICMVNIALCLLVADVWFIVAANVKATVNPSGICIAAVFFTHFFYLSLFFWMLTLGILLAYRVIFVFHHMAISLMMAIGFCLGYGCPLIISVITIMVTEPSNSYKKEDVCWLNWSRGSKPLLAFCVPALTIVAVNLVVVLLVLTKVWRPAIGERLSRDNKATIIRMGKSLLILTPLLGLTWGVGIGTMVDSQNLVWHVIFTLLNAFQGFFILCFGILLDSKVCVFISLFIP